MTDDKSRRAELLEQSMMRAAASELYDALYAMMYGFNVDEVRRHAWAALASAEGRHVARGHQSTVTAPDTAGECEGR